MYEDLLLKRRIGCGGGEGAQRGRRDTCGDSVKWNWFGQERNKRRRNRITLGRVAGGKGGGGERENNASLCKGRGDCGRKARRRPVHKSPYAEVAFFVHEPANQLQRVCISLIFQAANMVYRIPDNRH